MKWLKKNKKFIILLLIFSTIAVGFGYSGKSAFIAKFNNNQVEEDKPIDKVKETLEIQNLVKSYLVSSTNLDWDTVVHLTTGNYSKELQLNIIPKAQELAKQKKVKYVFNPTSLSVNVSSLTDKEAVADVDYIVERTIDDQTVKSQEKLKLYLSKENNIWLIFSIENINQ